LQPNATPFVQGTLAPQATSVAAVCSLQALGEAAADTEATANVTAAEIGAGVCEDGYAEGGFTVPGNGGDGAAYYVAQNGTWSVLFFGNFQQASALGIPAYVLNELDVAIGI
jgi:hypothetical protein